MKKIIISIALLLLVTVAYSQNEEIRYNSPHGGKLKKEKNYYIELVSNTSNILIYIYNSKIKPIPNKNIKGNAVFCYTNDACINKVLQDKGNNSFIIDIENPQYYFIDISLKIKKEFISVKFDNQVYIAD